MEGKGLNVPRKKSVTMVMSKSITVRPNFDFNSVVGDSFESHQNNVSENAKPKTYLVIGGNQVYRTDVEVLDVSRNSSVCTKPANIPEEFSRGAVGAYLNKVAILCGGWFAGKECIRYDFSTHQWSDVPYSLQVERAEAAGAMLQNGSWLIIGGKGVDRNALPSTELLDNGFFSLNLLWPEAISNQCVEKLNGSHFFVAGGENMEANLLDTAYFLDTNSGIWVSLERRLTYKRSGHVCGLVETNDARFIVIAGGLEILETELLDLKLFRLYKGPNLPFEMNWAAGVHVSEVFAIVGGEHIGYCSKAGMCFASNTIFELDLGSNAWKILDHGLMLPRSNHIILEVDDEQITQDLCQDSCPTCKGELGP